MPGLPVLVLPAFVVAGAWGAVVMMCLFGAPASLVVLTRRTGRAAALRRGRRGRVCRSPCRAACPGDLPEMAGAAIVAWAPLWARMRRRRIDDGGWERRVSRLCCTTTKFSVFRAVAGARVMGKSATARLVRIAFAAPIAVVSAGSHSSS